MSTATGATAIGNSPVAVESVILKEEALKTLLEKERQRNERRRENYNQLQAAHIKLGQDYLALQSEMKTILEETKFLKKQKEDELEEAQQRISEQAATIERLRKELGQRDPDLIELRLTQKLAEPQHRLEKENDKLLVQREELLGDLKCFKQKVEHLEKEIVDSQAKVKLAHEAEINLVRREKEELRVKLLELTKTPEGQQIATLTGEVERLTGRLRSKEKALEEATREYSKIQETIENIGTDQEKMMIKYENQIESLRGQVTAFREENIKLDEHLKHLQREREKLREEIKRLENDREKLVKSIETADRAKEKEKEKLRQSFVREKNDLKLEKVALQDVIRRLKQDLELKNETLGRLEKSIETKEKEFQLRVEVTRSQELNERNALERERDSLANRMAEVNEEKNRLKIELANTKRTLEANSETRMSLEKENIILKAKIESFQTIQEDVDRLRAIKATCSSKLEKTLNEMMKVSAVKQELTIRLSSLEEENVRLKRIMEEERKELIDFKRESEKIIGKLKSCLEEERNERINQLRESNDECRRKSREREEIKVKCKQYQGLVEKLQVKVKSLEDNVAALERRAAEMVPLRAYKELKRTYKELKQKINDLPTANLTSNHSYHHVHHTKHHQHQQQHQPALPLTQHQIKINKTTKERQTTTTT